MLVDIPQEPFLDDFGELLLLISDCVCLLIEFSAGFLLVCLPSALQSVHGAPWQRRQSPVAAFACSAVS